MIHHADSNHAAVSVQLRRLPAITAFAIHARGPYWKLSGTLSRLRDRMTEAGVSAAGAPLGLFHDDPAQVPSAETRYTLCYPLDGTDVQRAREHLAVSDADAERTDPAARPPALGDAFEILEFPAVEAATADYHGPAADSPAVYARVEAWMVEHHYAADGSPREVYHAEPGTLGKGMMHAEVQQPVRRQAAAAR